MPVNWSDPSDVQAFRSAALQQPGADSTQIDEYIANKSGSVTSSVPKIEAPNASVLPTPDPLIPETQNTNLVQAVQQKKAAEQAPAISQLYDSTGKTDQQILAETGRQSTLDTLGKNGVDLSKASMAPLVSNQPVSGQQAASPMQQTPQVQTQQGVLPDQFPLTQHAGHYNPNVEIYSHGYSRDTNFAAPVGTPVALPPGTWKVVSTYGDAAPSGGPRGENQGYGNMVKAVNTATGESMIFQHLSEVGVGNGQTLQGGSVIGKTGNSGNTTGANLGIEYADKYGRIRDISRSPYSSYLFGT